VRRDAIVIQPYDPSWPTAFDREQQRLVVVLHAWLERDIEHIGSTAVPGLPAKPIIDMLGVVHSVDDVRPSIQPMHDIGWVHAPEPTDEGDCQLSFCTPTVEYRTHHLHVVDEDSTRWRGWLAFRDYLREHPDVASSYADLKRALADQHGHDPNQRDAYRTGKADFVRRITQTALAERP
jgi:GrpB-like predicted nucleotidyltransferase (UPF0157 family)